MKKTWLATIIAGCLVSSSCAKGITAETAAESTPEYIVNVSVTDETEYGTENTQSGSQDELPEGQSYYRDFISKANEDSYLLSGTVYQDQEKMGLVRVEAPDGITLSAEGKLIGREGNLKLVFQRADGAEIILAEISGETGDEVVVDASVVVEKGVGDIYFEGSGAVCQFDLSLSYSEDIRYYLTGSNPAS